MTKNALIIVIDALRADRVYQDNNLTPHIDQIKETSTQFTSAFSTTNATDPALTSLNTGRYPLSHGIINHGDRVTRQEKSQVEVVPQVSELLQNQGYYTFRAGRPLGRWHRNGFQDFPSLDSNSPYKDIYTRIVRKFWNILPSTLGRLRYKRERYRNSKNFKTILETVKTLEEPFYGIIHLMDTHAPYIPDNDIVDRLLETKEYENTPLTELLDRFSGAPREEQLRNTVYVNPEKLGTAKLKARYDGSVVEADKKVGAIVEALKNTGQFSDTLLTIVADHGESLDEHEIYFDHHGLYDCTVRIPLIIRTPDEQEGIRNELVQLTDIAPTILDYIGHVYGCDLDGRSLRPLITGNINEWNKRVAVLAEEAHTQRRRAIRTHDYKYIQLIQGNTVCRYCGISHANSDELYDLESDPGENKNLSSKFGDKKKELQALSKEIAEEFTPPPVEQATHISYNEEEKIQEHLRDLGYR